MLGSVVVTSGSVGASSSTPQASETKSASPRADPVLWIELPVSVRMPRGSPKRPVTSVAVRSQVALLRCWLQRVKPQTQLTLLGTQSWEQGARAVALSGTRWQASPRRSGRDPRVGPCHDPPLLQPPTASGRLAHVYTLIAMVGARVNVGVFGCLFGAPPMKMTG